MTAAASCANHSIILFSLFCSLKAKCGTVKGGGVGLLPCKQRSVAAVHDGRRACPCVFERVAVVLLSCVPHKQCRCVCVFVWHVQVPAGKRQWLRRMVSVQHAHVSNLLEIRVPLVPCSICACVAPSACRGHVACRCELRRSMQPRQPRVTALNCRVGLLELCFWKGSQGYLFRVCCHVC